MNSSEEMLNSLNPDLSKTKKHLSLVSIQLSSQLNQLPVLADEVAWIEDNLELVTDINRYQRLH